jgi:hypothetical protein
MALINQIYSNFPERRLAVSTGDIKEFEVMRQLGGRGT